MDGKVKSRGRRSLVKRHRDSRLSVPVPAARGSELSSLGAACCSPARRVPGERSPACVRGQSRTAGALPGTTSVTAIWTLSEALFLATAAKLGSMPPMEEPAGCDGP